MYNHKKQNTHAHSQEEKTNIKTFKSLCWHFKKAMDELGKLTAENERLKARIAELESKQS